MTKKNEIKYGIEITKPHSTEMYQHNDEVAHAMKSNMGEALSKNYDAAKKAWYDNGECEVFGCRHEKALRDIGMAIEGVGYGDGYNLDDILQGALNNLDNMANWQLHEEYSYLQFKGLVPRTHFMMIGFNTQEWPAGTPINYDYTNANELSPASPESVPSGLNGSATVEEVLEQEGVKDVGDIEYEDENPDGMGMQC